jgi:cation transporter-like permease
MLDKYSDDHRPHGLDDAACRSQPSLLEESFYGCVKERAGWLVGLLILQSMSSFILAQNEALLEEHMVIIRFLTMLVGAGGNAGNQASVRGSSIWCARLFRCALLLCVCCYTPTRKPCALFSSWICFATVIRGLATGEISDSNTRFFFDREMKMGLALSGLLGLAGCFRAALFQTPFMETIAITSSLLLIVTISILLGVLLPFGMKSLRIDPAHSSTTIQVFMDILGVWITVHVSRFVLDSDWSWLTRTVSMSDEWTPTTTIGKLAKGSLRHIYHQRVCHTHPTILQMARPTWSDNNRLNNVMQKQTSFFRSLAYSYEDITLLFRRSEMELRSSHLESSRGLRLERWSSEI